MKTKIALAVAVLVIVSMSVSGKEARAITSREAVMAADHHLSRLGRSLDYTLNDDPKEIKSEKLVLAFVFELIPQGYLVVTASTLLSPVLAYSFESDFGALNRSNPLFELITSDLLTRMEYAASAENSHFIENIIRWEALLHQDLKSHMDPFFEQWPATGDGWLKTNWTQNSPYNNFCPMDPVTGVRSYAGCPATAMAQIMNFHATTNNTHFDDSDDYFHNYAGRQYWIDDDFEYADFPSFPLLNEYLDTLNAHYLNNGSLTNEDKAALTFGCGVAARQVFTSQGSGTFGVDQAYDAYFRFGCNLVELLDSNDAGLFDRLSQNIKDTLPAHLAIVNEEWTTGHNVVVDGYNTDEYYHLNFGWGGSYNGWYMLPEEIPYELTVIEGVVVDIMKKNLAATGNLDLQITVTSVYPNPVIKNAVLQYTHGNPGPVSICIYTGSGAEILKYKVIEQVPGIHLFTISLEDKPAGIYYYTLQSGTGLSSGKIIKVN